jgi:S1-C subfamily serine protease
MLAVAFGFDRTLTTGVISGLNRDIRRCVEKFREYRAKTASSAVSKWLGSRQVTAAALAGTW